MMMSLSLHISLSFIIFLFFFFNHTPPPEIYTLSLHDALPISLAAGLKVGVLPIQPEEDAPEVGLLLEGLPGVTRRSEEHTSELQSRPHLVCRLLLEKKKKKKKK